MGTPGAAGRGRYRTARPRHTGERPASQERNSQFGCGLHSWDAAMNHALPAPEPSTPRHCDPVGSLDRKKFRTTSSRSAGPRRELRETCRLRNACASRRGNAGYFGPAAPRLSKFRESLGVPLLGHGGVRPSRSVARGLVARRCLHSRRQRGQPGAARPGNPPLVSLALPRLPARAPGPDPVPAVKLTCVTTSAAWCRVDDCDDPANPRPRRAPHPLR